MMKETYTLHLTWAGLMGRARAVLGPGAILSNIIKYHYIFSHIILYIVLHYPIPDNRPSFPL